MSRRQGTLGRVNGRQDVRVVAGTPTGTPQTNGGALWVFDSTNSLMYGWNGTAYTVVDYRAAAFSTYTPTLTQSGAVTKTTTRAAYSKIGRQVTVGVNLALTGAGTGNNAILLGLPEASVAMTADIDVLGNGIYFDSGVATYPLVVRWRSTTTVSFQRTDATPTNVFGIDPNFACASGDVLTATLTYEAAA